MRRKLRIGLLILLIALSGAAQIFRSVKVLKETAQCLSQRFWEGNFGIVSAAEKLDSRRQDDRNDLPERDEIRQSHRLAPGATVEVASINGSVTIETSNTDTAEILVVRSARERSDLQRRKVIIEATPQTLVVRGEKEERGSWRKDVRQRVVLRVPRQVELTVRGINGRVSVSEIEGAVRLSGINGRVEVAQAVGYSEISGVNGSVNLTIARLGERGLRMNGINGAVDLLFDREVNADLSISGHNGAVDTQLPNVTLEGKLNRSNLRARIGAGGAPITISGVNGRVRLGLRES